MAPPLPGPVVPGDRRRRSRTPRARLWAAAAGERAARSLLPGGGGTARAWRALCNGDAGAEGLFEIDAWALAGVAARIINGV
uniref:Uncharacterized protein n=1 Tax=Oryza meridionalis TaxID=40149 RepID=A0A0E0DXL8_9ORYZ